MWWTFLFLTLFIGSLYAQIVFPGERCETIYDFCECDSTNLNCDCNGESMKLENSMTSEKQNITIRNCEDLSIRSESRSTTGPLTISLENINHMSLFPGSFAIQEARLKKIDLRIINSTIEEMPSNLFSTVMGDGRVLVGPINLKLRLTMINTNINTIKAKTFEGVDIETLSIINSRVENIQRFAVQSVIEDKLEIINSTFKLIAKRAIILQNQKLSPTKSLSIKGNFFKEKLPLFLNGNVSGDVYITNNTFSTLTESPWNLAVGNDVFVINNTFKNIPKNGLQLQVLYRITMSNNTIKRLEGNAFQMIIPQEEKTAIFITGNTIERHDTMSLCLNKKFNGNYVIIKSNLFKQKCLCNITRDIADSLGVANLTIEYLYEDKIHQQWFQHGKCVLEGSEIAMDFFLVQTCLRNNRLTMVLLITFAVILIAIAFCVIVAWRRIKQRNYVQASEADYHSFSAPAPSSMGQIPWSLVNPDTRTYQETEIHVLFHKAEEMDDRQDSKDILDNPEKNNEKAAREDGLHQKTPSVRQSCPALP